MSRPGRRRRIGRLTLHLRRPGGLWWHGDFLKLWAAETVSQLGSQIGFLALGLVAVIVLRASPLEVALLGVLQFLPFVLVSLPAGVWVDRLRRRPILVAADLGRFVLLLTIPLAYWLGVLTVEQLFLVGFLAGVCTVFFDVSYQSYLPSLVTRERLVEGNSKLEVSRSGAQIAGPGLAGVLVELLTAPVAVLLDAVSFLASALFLGAIRTAETVTRPAQADGRRPTMRAELAEGLRYVLGHRYLRWIAASTATFNFFGSVAFAIFLVYAVRELGLSPVQIGLVSSLGNVGYLAGALVTGRLGRALGPGPTIVLGAALGGATVLYPLAPADSPLPYLIAGQVLVSLGIPIYNITQVSFRQAITPERLQGRMNSVIRFLVWGVMPLGSLTGGAVATAVDLRFAMWLGAVGVATAFLPVALSPVRTLRELPEPAPSASTDAAARTPAPALPDG